MIMVAICIILYGLTKEKISPLNGRNVIALRGICAIEIMIGHIGLATGSIILYPNRKAGILFVGIFFLLSGYGLSYCEKEKHNYFDGFLIKKAIRLFVPAYFCYLVYVLIGVFVKESIHISNIIDMKMFVGNINWYVWELFFFYILYRIANRFFNKYKIWLVGIVSILFICIAFIMKVDNPWYGSTMCFLLGILYYKYEKEFQLYIEKKKFLKFICGMAVLIVSILLFMVIGNESIIGNPVARNVAAVTFCFVVLILLSEFKIGNPFSELLGKCSYEIFLLHPFVQSLCSDLLDKSEILYSWCVIAITIILSIAIHYPINKCLGFVDRKLLVSNK